MLTDFLADHCYNYFYINCGFILLSVIFKSNQGFLLYSKKRKSYSLNGIAQILSGINSYLQLSPKSVIFSCICLTTTKLE